MEQTSSLLSTPDDGAGRRGSREPGSAGGGFCPRAERHTPAGAVAVAVAGPDPRSDGHLGSHPAASAAGHPPAGTGTHSHTSPRGTIYLPCQSIHLLPAPLTQPQLKDSL